ncbi:7TM diverse intracellular signaling domain-containing protein [Mucilaginibacter litoreus]|uniref:7TM diverse intracellular signaling domain-containing protein n=1 Tax=Mucilaginibacter litoreus TaxID=1048221 RepID=A0ABW3AYV8_9SPHI
MDVVYRRVWVSFILLFFLAPLQASAQQPVVISDTDFQHIFTFKEVEGLYDASGKLSFDQIRNRPFAASKSSTPQNTILNGVYWYKISIKPKSDVRKQWLLEFFDQTIDDITAYLPDGKGGYYSQRFGDAYQFTNRRVHHKNFEVPLKQADISGTYYFRIKSHQPADIIIVLRSVNWFIQYANDEYFSFGIFYGMILIFGFYNLLMFMAVRSRQYLYYTLYLFSIGLYEMCTDGLAFQYLWPSAPAFNQYAFAIALCLISVFCLLFTRALLRTSVKVPVLDRVIVGVLLCRVLFLICGFVFNRDLFNYKFIEFIPLVLALTAGIVVYRKGYRPALYFIIGYGCLCFGFIYKVLIMLHFDWLNIGAATYYSLTISFIAEMIFLSIAIAVQVSELKRTRDKAQRQMIREMKKSRALEQKLNKELEQLVEVRTKELKEQTTLVEAQNVALEQKNRLLLRQSEEISRMNVLLEKDNEELHTNVVQITRSRIMSEEVDFSEFSKIYPDSESCFAYLAQLKWNAGYHCRKCGNEHYFAGHVPHSRRCAKCDYEESVIAYTIFQNSRIPITKAFYLLFLIYSTKGKISSHKLSEILDIRQGTCWSYSNKIKKLMDGRKKELKETSKGGWSKLVLE